MAAKAWKSLAKKVKAFNDKFPGSSVVCLGLIDNVYVSEDEERQEMEVNLPVEESSVREVLQQHVFDMEVSLMRSIIAQVVSPPSATSNKDARRNWYSSENCPGWWRATGLKFQSVNHAPAGSKKLTKIPLMRLIESLQRYLGVTPQAPKKQNKTDFVSCFLYDASEDITDDVQEPNEDITDGDGVPEHNEDITKIRIIFHEDVSLEEKALNTMKQLNSWEDLLLHADDILERLPKSPSMLAGVWTVPLLTDINKRYQEFIPASVGQRRVLQSSPNGNCIFNAVSIALYGDEEMAMVLKLASVLTMVNDVIPFSKYITEQYRNDTKLWVGSVSTNTGILPQDVTTCCQNELLQTLKHPYMDGSTFHLHLLTHLLKRPIQQHCSKKNYHEFSTGIFPPLDEINYPSPIHIVWVPTKPRSQYATINHVVPAVCKLGPYGTHVEECAFLGLGVCAFADGFNRGESNGWVECTICGQWVHDVCMGIEAKDYSSVDFPCGCDLLRDGLVPIKSADYYQTLKVEDLDIEYKAIVKNINERISLRKDLFQREGHGRMKFFLRFGRFGPFNEELIDEVNKILMTLVTPEKQALVPDIYMPEVLLHVISRTEGVNRLLAEMALSQKYVHTELEKKGKDTSQ